MRFQVVFGYGWKSDIAKVADRQLFRDLRFIIFRQQKGMHAYAFLFEKQKIDL